MRRPEMWCGLLSFAVLLELAACGSDSDSSTSRVDSGTDSSAGGAEAGNGGTGALGGTLAGGTAGVSGTSGDGSVAGGGALDGSAGASDADAGGDAPGSCGNGAIEPGEECDDGMNNAPGSGCETSCMFSCHTDPECSDSKSCNGFETCAPNAAGRACAAGSALAEGTQCGPNHAYCKAGACVAPVCGNGAIEPGETCEPPAVGGCNASCTTSTCGDGQITGGEQCDDGNVVNLDGCDSGCRYETVMRLTSFSLVAGTMPSFCMDPANAFGAAISQEALTQLNQANPNTGTSHHFLEFFELDDLTGKDDAFIQIGSVPSGSIDSKHAGNWSIGVIDWWYLANPAELDASGKPLRIFDSGTLAQGTFVAGPGSLLLDFVVGNQIRTLDLRRVMVKGRVDDPPAPDVPPPPPSALAPGSTVFQSISMTQSDHGICGAVTVGSLAAIPVPKELTTGIGTCQSGCAGSKSYTYCGDNAPVGPGCNSLLDVLVGGCSLTLLCLPGIFPTQPDVGTDGNPPAQLTAGSDQKVTPTSPTDGYSILGHATANRAHFTNNLP